MRAVAVTFVQGRQNRGAFDMRKSRGVGAHLGVCRMLADCRRQVLGQDDVAAAQQARTLDRVAQLANVTRPGVSQKSLRRLR